jgi:hypothetical protein
MKFRYRSLNSPHGEERWREVFAIAEEPLGH